jgi:hypothetical protein
VRKASLGPKTLPNKPGLCCKQEDPLQNNVANAAATH